MKRTASTPVNPAIVEAAARNHWRSIVLATCMRNAALLNIVAWGETDLRKLPDSVYEVAFRKCAELRDGAVAQEIALGSRPSFLEQQVNAELWRFLKPHAKAGEHYLGHMSAEVPRETQQLPLESNT